MFAMQPDAKRSRTLAMSYFSVSTGTHGLDRHHVRTDDRQDDVEIVNHEIEDDVDVEAAIGERAEPVHFDEARARDEPQRDGDRRIVPLGVADGEHRPAGGGRGDHPIGVGERARHRLLDQHRRSPFEERHRDLGVELGRHGDDHTVDLSEEVTIVRQRRRARRAGDLGARSLLLSTTAVSRASGMAERIRAWWRPR